MEQRKPHTRSEAFAEQFTSVLYEHWSDILLFVHRQSPRLASLLRTVPSIDFMRMAGTWHIHIQTLRIDKLHQPRDNEIVAQAIRLWAHSAAHLKLPFVSVEFEQYHQT